MTKIGFVLNPIAGIGGKVGLKGSDGADTLTRALELGARPECAQKARIALAELQGLCGEVTLYTFPGEMGEAVARAMGFSVQVTGSIRPGATTPADTAAAAKAFRDAGVDILLFAGGDGTARNILDAVGQSLPAVGIPAGCKIHSAVYAVNPRAAGKLMTEFVSGRVKDFREAEVMDIDEELFRRDIVEARLYGYLRVPNQRTMIQNLKSGRGPGESGSIDMLANYIADSMLPDTLYIVGSGSTTRVILGKLGLSGTLLGVDLVYNGGLVATDVTEQGILDALCKYPRARVLVTVIGGQGYIFGRGNQQLSAGVLERVGKENILIAASKDKMLSLFGCKLYLDTGDEAVNQALCGYYKIIVGYEEYMMFPATDSI